MMHIRQACQRDHLTLRSKCTSSRPVHLPFPCLYSVVAWSAWIDDICRYSMLHQDDFYSQGQQSSSSDTSSFTQIAWCRCHPSSIAFLLNSRRPQEGRHSEHMVYSVSSISEIACSAGDTEACFGCCLLRSIVLLFDWNSFERIHKWIAGLRSSSLLFSKAGLFGNVVVFHLDLGLFQFSLFWAQRLVLVCSLADGLQRGSHAGSSGLRLALDSGLVCGNEFHFEYPRAAVKRRAPKLSASAPKTVQHWNHLLVEDLTRTWSSGTEGLYSNMESRHRPKSDFSGDSSPLASLPLRTAWSVSASFIQQQLLKATERSPPCPVGHIRSLTLLVLFLLCSLCASFATRPADFHDYQTAASSTSEMLHFAWGSCALEKPCLFLPASRRDRDWLLLFWFVSNLILIYSSFSLIGCCWIHFVRPVSISALLASGWHAFWQWRSLHISFDLFLPYSRCATWQFLRPL